MRLYWNGYCGYGSMISSDLFNAWETASLMITYIHSFFLLLLFLPSFFQNISYTTYLLLPFFKDEDVTEDSEDVEAIFGGPDQFESGYPESAPVLIIDGLAAIFLQKKYS